MTSNATLTPWTDGSGFHWLSGPGGDIPNTWANEHDPDHYPTIEPTELLEYINKLTGDAYSYVKYISTALWKFGPVIIPGPVKIKRLDQVCNSSYFLREDIRYINFQKLPDSEFQQIVASIPPLLKNLVDVLQMIGREIYVMTEPSDENLVHLTSTKMIKLIESTQLKAFEIKSLIIILLGFYKENVSKVHVSKENVSKVHVSKVKCDNIRPYAKIDDFSLNIGARVWAVIDETNTAICRSLDAVYKALVNKVGSCDHCVGFKWSKICPKMKQTVHFNLRHVLVDVKYTLFMDEVNVDVEDGGYDDDDDDDEFEVGVEDGVGVEDVEVEDVGVEDVEVEDVEVQDVEVEDVEVEDVEVQDVEVEDVEVEDVEVEDVEVEDGVGVEDVEVEDGVEDVEVEDQCECECDDKGDCEEDDMEKNVDDDSDSDRLDIVSDFEIALSSNSQAER
jgi:hypothetical protein